ncbi:MAG: molybdopterin-dependent oxidoreductase [Actinobacteria bacterium]|nr:molybdopterin-dependent oxidoreductase [Actinomycetota bacterium]
MNRQTAHLRVNGRVYELEVDSGATLLDTLREDLGLTGTKRGCSEGECGACTVLVDGVTVNSCLYPTMKASGHDILTVEGLGTMENLHPLQEAFLRGGAVQCGFCTPGMLLAAKALLDGNPNPTEDEIRLAISGNLCRCTGYAKIVSAVQDAARTMADGGSVGAHVPPLNVVEPVTVRGPAASAGGVGANVPRLEGKAKVLGAARFADDLSFPGMVHGKVLRSPHPHALIRKIDVSRAVALPGVAAVVTAADIPGRNAFGILIKDQPFLAADKVRFVGEAIAAVAAESGEIARRACSLIEVEYELLPAVFDPIEAMTPTAPQLFAKGNISAHRHIERGQVTAVLAQAAVVISETFQTQLVEHAYIEPEAGVAVPDTGGITAHVVSQCVHYHRSDLAAMLGWPVGRVRVVQTTVGGAFGGKIDLSLHPFIVLLAAKTGRPVKMVYTREESITATTKRHPFLIDMTFAADREGTLDAAMTRVIGDTGAYASYGPAVVTRAAATAFGPYHIPHVRVDTYAVHTNNPIAGAMRGFGVPQMATAHEQLMDMLAERVGLSPIEVRRRNGFAPGRALAPTGDIRDGLGYLETLERAAFGLHPSVGGDGADPQVLPLRGERL